MKYSEREAVETVTTSPTIDITKPGEVTTISVKQSNWNPAAGANAARAQAEAVAIAQHKHQLEALSSDPTVVRLANLESVVVNLQKQVHDLMCAIEELKVIANG